MKCTHCGTPKAGYSWTLRACADKRKPRHKWLCGPCDAALNLLVLQFFNDPKAAAKMAAYERATA